MSHQQAVSRIGVGVHPSWELLHVVRELRVSRWRQRSVLLGERPRQGLQQGIARLGVPERALDGRLGLLLQTAYLLGDADERQRLVADAYLRLLCDGGLEWHGLRLGTAATFAASIHGFRAATGFLVLVFVFFDTFLKLHVRDLDAHVEAFAAAHRVA